MKMKTTIMLKTNCRFRGTKKADVRSRAPFIQPSDVTLNSMTGANETCGVHWDMCELGVSLKFSQS